MLAFGSAVGTTMAKPASASPNSSSSKVYKIGQTAQVFNWKVRLDSVKFVGAYDYNILKHPKTDNFALVHVTLWNEDSKSWEYSSQYFNLYDLNSKNPEFVFSYAYDKVAGGHSVSGWIAFEHVKNDHKARLVFTPNEFSSNSLTWVLG